MTALVAHSGSTSPTAGQRCVRQPVYLVLTLIQPMIWLLLFGRAVLVVDSRASATASPTWSSSRRAWSR